MVHFTRAFFILPGKENSLARLAGQMQRNTEEVRRFYQRYGVLREVWRVQSTDHGMIVIVSTDMESEDKVQDFADSDGEFEVWYKSQVYDITGVDLNQYGDDPESEELFQYEAFRIESGGHS